MLRFVLLLALGFGAEIIPGHGDAHVVQKFDGTDANTSTVAFIVQDKWEVLWFSPRPMNLTVLTADGTVVTGSRGLFRGSLYEPKGGTYYLQLNGDQSGGKSAWHLIVAEVAEGTTLSGADANPMLASPGDPSYAPPSSILPPGGVAATPANPGVPANPFAVSNGGMPTAAPTPAPVVVPPTPAATPAPVVKLTDDQARAVVLITGDNSEGTGFLIKTPEGPAVVTNIHVIANNPNLKITTNSGALLTMLSAKGASDRDLVLIEVKDDNFNYLDVSTDISKTVLPGDDVITPGNSQGGEVMLNTAGKVLGIGPERIEIDNPIYHGNSGGPVFHIKSGKVLGVVTEAMKVDTTDDLDKVSFANRNSAISSSMRYFALRLDTVSGWVPIDWNRFQTETIFLSQFHDHSRYLDAYLNGKDNSGDTTNAGDAANLYRKDDDIMKANARYLEQSAGSDTSQQLEARRGLLFDLNGIADNNMTQIENANNFYSFDQDRARDETAYRRALKNELDSIGNDLDRVGRLPRTNSSE